MANRWNSPKAEHRFVQGWSLLAIALIIAGFGRSWFARAFVESPPGSPLDPVLILHGALFSAWIALFAFQIFNISTGNFERHRSLGRIVLFFIPVALASSLHVAIRNAARPSDGNEQIPADVFLLLPLMEIAMFCLLLYLGWRFRANAHVHKRMMMFAIAAIVGTGSGRLLGFVGTFFVPVLLVLAIWAFDWVRTRRIRRPILAGGILAAATYAIPLAFGFTASWRRIAGGMISYWTG